MNINIKLLPPSMPNFIQTERPPKPRQEGFSTSGSIPVKELTEEQAIEYGELMKQTFIQHWASKQ